MVENTFRIQGPSLKEAGKDILGTVFMLFSPNQDDVKAAKLHPEDAKVRGSFVIVTAAHVISGIRSDVAILYMRSKDASGTWVESRVPLQIRKNGKPLWTQHPVADVAVLQVQDNRVTSHLVEPFVWTTFLATDAWMKDFQLHPGDEVTCLGYPEGLHSKYGFPILRVGRIASYPIVPTFYSRPLYIDFPVYGGNSGGPAYIIQPSGRGNVITAGNLTPNIIGLVIEKQFGASDTLESVYASTGQPNESKLDDMHLAVLEPSSVIAETLGLLRLP